MSYLHRLRTWLGQYLPILQPIPEEFPETPDSPTVFIKIALDEPVPSLARTILAMVYGRDYPDYDVLSLLDRCGLSNRRQAQVPPKEIEVELDRRYGKTTLIAQLACYELDRMRKEGVPGQVLVFVSSTHSVRAMKAEISGRMRACSDYIGQEEYVNACGNGLWLPSFSGEIRVIDIKNVRDDDPISSVYGVKSPTRAALFDDVQAGTPWRYEAIKEGLKDTVQGKLVSLYTAEGGGSGILRIRAPSELLGEVDTRARFLQDQSVHKPNI